MQHKDYPNTSPILSLVSKELLAEISDMTNAGGWVFDVKNEVLEWTEETYRIYGLPSGSQIDPSIGIKHYTAEAQDQIAKAFSQAIENGSSYLLELPFIDKQGNRKWIRTTGKVRKNSNVVEYVYGVFEDITHEKMLLSQKQNTANYLEAVVNHLNDSVIIINESGYIISVNKTTEKIFRCKSSELIGKEISILMPESFAQSHSTYMETYLKTGNAKIMGIGRELPARRYNGEEFPMELSLTEMLQNGERFFVGIIKDISERKEALAQIYKLAYFDSLTLLPNRNSFEQDLDNVIKKARLTQQSIYCGLLDIDNFSEMNLIYGTQIGDKILRMTANTLEASLPESFKLYRNIADSFFLLSLTPRINDEMSSGETISALESIIEKSFKLEKKIDQHSIAISMSFFSLCIPSFEINDENLIQLLEFSAKKAKGQGKNQKQVLNKSLSSSYEKQAQIRRSMLTGLEQGEFYLQLQPQYAIAPIPTASEALLRWNSNTFGAIRPDEFIPLAEENGDIIAIGDWVINEVCQLLAKLQRQHIDTRIAVNISTKQIVQPDFTNKLLDQLSKWHVAPHSLMLEITESVLVQNVELVRKQMQCLSESGLNFSIDDFGTGYSSLRYLKELPLNELKIDRCFIEEITTPDDEVAIVNTILEMAKALGVQTVAEGIETAEQLQYMMQRGCNYFQGFYLSKPLDIEPWLTHLNQEESKSLNVF